MQIKTACQETVAVHVSRAQAFLERLQKKFLPSELARPRAAPHFVRALGALFQSGLPLLLEEGYSEGTVMRVNKHLLGSARDCYSHSMNNRPCLILHGLTLVLGVMAGRS